MATVALGAMHPAKALNIVAEALFPHWDAATISLLKLTGDTKVAEGASTVGSDPPWRSIVHPKFASLGPEIEWKLLGTPEVQDSLKKWSIEGGLWGLRWPQALPAFTATQSQDELDELSAWCAELFGQYAADHRFLPVPDILMSDETVQWRLAGNP
ncbi:MAG: hypothetical protein WC211_03240 [Dehalococcoidia bacterium]